MAKKTSTSTSVKSQGNGGGGNAFPIPGLNPISATVSGDKSQPGALTLEDLAGLEEVRFVESILDPEPFNSLLLGIQSWLQAIVAWGLNPKLVGLGDFNLAVIATKHDPVPDPTNPLVDLFVSAGPLLVAQHKTTGKYNNFGLIAPNGVSQDNFNRTTAISLVELGAQDDPPPVEYPE
jgi:hypothetical protein